MITFRQFLELAESSTPEKGKRRLAPHGPKKNKYSRGRVRSDVSDKIALKKAGFKRPASDDHYPTDSVTKSSEHHSTNVASYKSQSDYAKSELPGKKASGRGVRKTSDRVRKLKGIRKQMKTTRTSRPVHDVSIHGDDENRRKNDSESLISRGKSFKKEIRAVPDSVRKSGAKSGDIVTSTPAGIMPGENRKEGAKKRDKIYTKELGSKMSPRTGKTMGTMRG